MNKFAFVLAVAAVSFYTVGAEAGGFGGTTKIIGGNSGVSSGLINVSPSIGLGNVTALNNILSGNNVSGILSGNKTSVGNGILGAVGLSGLGDTLIGNNSGYNNTSYKLGGSKHHR
ncbi:hypothetical protein [Aquamicrobium soli]|jgi:hypothetical protein|uniref:Uncharacterized protein n=1 Tax=Aquamicrobium soli TaxID=1811518 RepID=A0ABV7KIZ1_9HYPH